MRVRAETAEAMAAELGRKLDEERRQWEEAKAAMEEVRGWCVCGVSVCACVCE